MLSAEAGTPGTPNIYFQIWLLIGEETQGGSEGVTAAETLSQHRYGHVCVGK
jgi:hypothetical protein